MDLAVWEPPSCQPRGLRGEQHCLCVSFFPGLANTLRGFWKQARCVLSGGLRVPGLPQAGSLPSCPLLGPRLCPCPVEGILSFLVPLCLPSPWHSPAQCSGQDLALGEPRPMPTHAFLQG